MTLKTWVKNRIESGQDLDFDLFGVYQGNRAKIKEVSNEPSCTEKDHSSSGIRVR